MDDGYLGEENSNCPRIVREGGLDLKGRTFLKPVLILAFSSTSLR
jgi:hypothetical protein